MATILTPRGLLALFLTLGVAIFVGVTANSAVLALATTLAGVAAWVLASTAEGFGEPVQAPPPAPPAPPQLMDETKALIDAIAEPVFILERTRITLANGAAIRLLGTHIVGDDVRTAIRHPAAAERLTDTSRSTVAIDLVGLGALDQRWRMRVTPIGEDRRLVHLANRTGSYAAERMRVDFVANASHELRTPLASILGYVETLGEEAGEDPVTRARFVRIVLDEARRMQRLVEDLMSLSRIEAEKYRLPDANVDLSELVEEVRQETIDRHSARDRKIVADIGAAMPLVRGDRAQLSQMLHNLVGNALKYGASGTPVRIVLSSEGERTIRLTVSDEGEGIAPEHLPRLTERFYRVDTGRSRSLGGTGLGLAIVKHIVERHRGRLDIASTPGTGTQVSVALPAADVRTPVS